MKQISYYVSVLALSTLLLLLGYEDHNLLADYSPTSFTGCLLIAFIIACLSRRPARFTFVSTIGIVYIGPLVFHCIYNYFYSNKMINSHVINILIVLGVILLGQFLRSPPDAKTK